MRPGFLDPYSPFVIQSRSSNKNNMRFSQQNDDFYVDGAKVSVNKLN